MTLRAAAVVPSLRHGRTFPIIRTALAAASHDGFRVLHYSVQRDHLHLLVEADAPARFTRGVQGLAIRIAKAVNRAVGRRGRVWADRFHARLLRTPREVRNALVYVLNNVRKHLPTSRGIDPCSSGRWFGGWRTPLPAPSGPVPVAAPRTWLARTGWRRWGALEVDERPLARPPRRAPRSASS